MGDPQKKPRPSDQGFFCPCVTMTTLAEREGFEPSDPVTQVKSLAVTPIRPLSHLSSWTFTYEGTGLSTTGP